METQAAILIRGAGFAAAGALFWLMYIDLKDVLRREPRRLLGTAFVLGGLSAVLALAAYRVVPWIGGPPHAPDEGAVAVLLYCVFVVGVIEEGAKFLVARGIVYRARAFDEPVDALVYAGAVAIGFATFENLLYIEILEWRGQLARSLTSPLTHSLWAAVWGFGAARAFFTARTRGARIAWQVGSLALAVVLHGAYDTFLIAYGASYLSAVLVLVVWLGLIAYMRRLVGRSVMRRARSRLGGTRRP